MIFMNKATKNSDDLIDKITLQMNKVRQMSITRELFDIVGGSEAMQH